MPELQGDGYNHFQCDDFPAHAPSPQVWLTTDGCDVESLYHPEIALMVCALIDSNVPSLAILLCPSCDLSNACFASCFRAIEIFLCGMSPECAMVVAFLRVLEEVFHDFSIGITVLRAVYVFL